MLALFAACNKNNNGNNGGNDSPGGTNPEFVYVPSYNTLSAEITDMIMPKIVNGTVYFFSNVVVGQYTPDESEYGDIDFGDMPIPRTADSALNAAVGENISDGDDEGLEGTTDPDKPDEEYVPQPVDITEIRLFKINADGTGYKQIEGYRPPALPPEAPQYSSYSITQFLPGTDGTAWICENGYFGYYNEETQTYVDNNDIQISKINLESGETVTELDISPILAKDQYASISSMIADSSGNVAVVGYDNENGNNVIYMFGSDGKLLFLIDLNSDIGWINFPVLLSDGRLAISLYTNDNHNIVRPIDMTAKKLGDSIGDVPNNVYNSISIMPDGKTLYTYDETGIFSFEFGKPERTYFVNWLDSDVDGAQLLGAVDENKMLCMQFDYSVYETNPQARGPKIEFITLTKTKSSEVPQKKIITLACVYLDWNLRSEIIKFNKRDPDYRIRVNDYSIYNTSDDYTAGTTKLNTEIIAGNVPDIIYTNNVPFGVYASKGMIEDLYPMLDADPEFGGRGILVPAVAKALESADGKLLQIASSFQITTYIGKAGIVGEKPGWTMDELTAAAAKIPGGARIFPYYFTRDDFMYNVFTFNTLEYVDWETGECKFDTPEFSKLLDLAKSLPETYNWEQNNGKYINENLEIMNDRQLLQQGYLGDFNSYLQMDTMLNGELAFKGFPCESRKGSAFEFNSGLAMSTKCANKDGAWKFMRILLTEEYHAQYNSWAFPINQKMFDKQMESAMTENTVPYEWGYAAEYDGGEKEDVIEKISPEIAAEYKGRLRPDGTYSFPKGYVWIYAQDGTDQSIPYYAMTAEARDKLLEFINSIDRSVSRDEKILEIVTDELHTFFAGQKSAQDAVKIIQSRVSIYVNEQR
jgi:ABC-type glycerol-3-phosphate transport system substrate-binding protein